MLENFTARESDAEKHAKLPSSDSLLKISLVLMLFAVFSSALVYAETISVDIDGTSFDIEYDVTGMTVSKIEADTSFTSLILTVDVTESPGKLDITFERTFFNSIFDGTDDDFIVIVDGAEPLFSETNTAQSRTLSIELPAGIDEVEIIGTDLASDTEPDPPADVTPDPDPPADVTPDPDPPADVTPDPDPPADVTPDPDPPADVTPDPDPPADVTPDPPAPVPVPDTPADVTPDPDTDVPDALSPCGLGTTLQGDTCVLDDKCGTGTILKDGECVLDNSSRPAPPPASIAGLGKDFVTGIAVAFVGAGIFAIVMSVISKASKSS